MATVWNCETESILRRRQKSKRTALMLPEESWYTDLEAIAQDETALQRVYSSLRADLSTEARERTSHVHVYPSRRCSYTIAKERIFIRVRAPDGTLLPDCVIRHVLLHELAHTLNITQGHDASFRSSLEWIQQDGGRRVSSCADRVPAGYNPCH